LQAKKKNVPPNIVAQCSLLGILYICRFVGKLSKLNTTSLVICQFTLERDLSFAKFVEKVFDKLVPYVDIK